MPNNAGRKRRSRRCLKALAALPVYTEGANEDTYERREFGHGWYDLDKDGEDARAEVLIAFHLPGRKRVRLAMDGKRVVSGRWRCRFSGDWFEDAGDLDIDHLVPLKDAWMSGAHAWDLERRKRYANGYGIRSMRRGYLIPVTASLNRQKGAKAPHEWMPPRGPYRFKYAAEWVETKKYWGLAVCKAEAAALKRALEDWELEVA